MTTSSKRINRKVKFIQTKLKTFLLPPWRWHEAKRVPESSERCRCLGHAGRVGQLVCEAMRAPEPTAALGWTLVVDGSWAGREGGSSCRAQGSGTATEDVRPWITTLPHQVPLFPCSHTQHPGHQKSKPHSAWQCTLNRHGLKWLEAK